MFEWLRSDSESGGLQRMRAEFGQMLDAGRHVFDMAANALLGNTDPEVIRDDLFATDKRINKAERQIRRELVIHASVHGAGDFPPCLVLMSIVKDAERVGDYAKNLFDLARLAPELSSEEHRHWLMELRDRISQLMATIRESYDARRTEGATEAIVEAKEIEDACDERIRALVQGGTTEPMAAAHVLAYRYFKRVASHMRNIASSMVQPVHKIDFTSKITGGQEE